MTTTQISMHLHAQNFLILRISESFFTLHLQDSKQPYGFTSSMALNRKASGHFETGSIPEAQNLLYITLQLLSPILPCIHQSDMLTQRNRSASKDITSDLLRETCVCMHTCNAVDAQAIHACMHPPVCSCRRLLSSVLLAVPSGAHNLSLKREVPKKPMHTLRKDI